MTLAYGVTEDEYDTLARDGCMICGRPRATRRLHIDHDHAHRRHHARGQKARAARCCVRGVLCHRCNRGLAWFNDNPAALRAAAQYLETAPGQRLVGAPTEEPPP